MDAKDFSWLAARQKRIKTWQDFNQHETQDPSIRSATEEKLSLLSNALLKVWDSRCLTPEELANIDNLERQLEQLNEEARLRVVAKES